MSDDPYLKSRIPYPKHKYHGPPYQSPGLFGSLWIVLKALATLAALGVLLLFAVVTAALIG